MYQGTRENSTPRQLFTGLSVMEFLGVNLTKQQIEERCGYTPETEPTYAKTEDQFGNITQNVSVFLKDKESGNVVRFFLSIGNEPNMSKTGNFQVCTTNGSVVWAGKSDGDACIIKDEFKDHRPLVRGEADLIAFVQKLCNYDTRSNENWMQQMTENQQSASDLFNQNYAGFNELYKWASANGNTLIMCLEVRDKDGSYQQSVCSTSKTWMSGNKVTEWNINRLKDLQKKEEETNRSLFRNMYTFKRQEFVKEDCLGVVPNNPSTSTTW